MATIELKLPGLYDYTGKVIQADVNRPALIISGTNIRIKGGLFVGNRTKDELVYGNGKHGIHIRDGAADVSLESVTCKNCSGDGIYVNGCTRLVISKAKCLGNRRQGMSIIRGKDIFVDSSTFADTHGTEPGDGIDIEPDKDDVIERVKINACTFYNNSGAHIEIAPKRGKVSGVIIKDCMYDGKSVPIKGIPVPLWAQALKYLGNYSGYPKSYP